MSFFVHMKQKEVQEVVGDMTVGQYTTMDNIIPDPADQASAWAGLHRMQCIDDGNVPDNTYKTIVRTFKPGPKCAEKNCGYLKNGSEGCILQNPTVARRYKKWKLEQQLATNPPIQPARREVSLQPQSDLRYSRSNQYPTQIPLGEQISE